MRDKSPKTEVPRTKWRVQDGAESEAGKRYQKNAKKTSSFSLANVARPLCVGSWGQTSQVGLASYMKLVGSFGAGAGVLSISEVAWLTLGVGEG